MDEDQVTPKSEAKPVVESEFDLESVYANNTRFEASVWDLRVLFGQLEQHTGKEVIDWHTAVTLPWMQVKILVYYLRANLIFHELQNGPLSLHPNVVPQLPPPPTPEILAATPNAKETYDAVVKLRSEMFG